MKVSQKRCSFGIISWYVDIDTGHHWRVEKNTIGGGDYYMGPPQEMSLSWIIIKHI